VAARTLLTALGLCAATLAFESGMGLRSRCLLWPDGPMEWELLDRPGATPTKASLPGDAAIKLLNEAIAAAETAKLPWTKERVLLKPSQELVKLVRLSQLEATKESGESA
jgi:CRISPR-associated protein Csb1